jgi:hypothetical protein
MIKRKSDRSRHIAEYHVLDPEYGSGEEEEEGCDRWMGWV